ncbi:hypothetical protein PIB30_009133 [Stylosanthes scabra]|uniref:AAA+ ATPase domain-containing protein n=1 Tax=Stylosanthes scabra TaxID=79078 RepID=A0ABU6X6Y9_9FABA|nr:hypothetical protein [Stylosanthes scabra]
MADEPMPTRWSFQDFKLNYDAMFGRKKVVVNGEAADKAVANGNSLNHASNGNLHVKRPAEMTIYEQFQSQGQNSAQTNGFSPNHGSEMPQKSLLPPFESAEMRTLAESLSRDIIRGNPNVKWESIKGLGNAKILLKEAVVMPIKYPKYFTGLLSPWKGILLFGPPGTGKTMLAKAVATECQTTFFNISASSVVSKWRGIQRGEARSEHEASRRLKTELLIQMDGLSKTDDLVFVLAATNLPWELDAAMLRRLEKRILVPLPEPEARRSMFEELLPPQPDGEEIPYDLLVERTEGYSGSDIRLLCKETAMQPLRRLMSQLEQKQEVVPEEELPKVGPIRSEDIETALKNTRPSAHLHAHKYEKFNADYGSQILH